MAALLKQPAEPRVLALELIQYRERIGRSLLLALGECEEIQRLPVSGRPRGKPCRGRAGRVEPT
jgi:hypothetical protein